MIKLSGKGSSNYDFSVLLFELKGGGGVGVRIKVVLRTSKGQQFFIFKIRLQCFHGRKIKSEVCSFCLGEKKM